MIEQGAARVDHQGTAQLLIKYLMGMTYDQDFRN